MTEKIKGELELKDVKGINFQYIPDEKLLIITIQTATGIVDSLSKNMARSKDKKEYESLSFYTSYVNFFE